jgi:small-conductance mechanosensitive channel
LLGYLAGGLARGGIARAARTSGVAYGDLLGRMVQTGVVIVALVVALDELGIDNTFLVMASGIFLASTLGGAAIAFGLGARASVGNLLASHYVQRNFRPGHIVRIGGIEGRIIEIGETSVVLETPEGRVHIPASLFGEQVSIVLTEGR